MDEFEATIGLEVHAELKTATKMFCDSRNDLSEDRPNSNICPVCLAHPGTLPVINREAVKHVLRVGVAIGSTLADYTEFDRKNYFYPDLPKGYQISQYEFPLISGGSLNGVQITRIHLEEDTASSTHDEETGETTIDYNRAGIPLMELVTEPVIKTAEQAGDFARELQLLLRTLGASEANMEKGQMRVEANVSVARKGERSKSYVEIKNLNSFNAMERAVAYEIKRQTQLIQNGEHLVKQTMGWDENKQATFPQRIKEGSADYRYFPDPDLPSLKLSEIEDFQRTRLAASLPELPWQKRERYIGLGIKTEDAKVYVRAPGLARFLEAVIVGKETDIQYVRLASNYIMNDLVSILKNIDNVRDSEKRDTENRSINEIIVPISEDNFRSIIDMLHSKKISSRAAKDLLSEAISTGGDPKIIAVERSLLQDAKADIGPIVARIVAENQKVVDDYKAGKIASLQYLIGQSMKALKGAADPELLRVEILKNIR